MNNSLKLFISHSSKDDDFGREIMKELTHALDPSSRIWYDSVGGLQPGDSWWTTIIERIQECTHFLVILSPAAMESHWVNDEMTMAWQQRVERTLTILPLLYHNCQVRNDYRTIQMVNFLGQRYEVALQQLLAMVREPASPMPYTQVFVPSLHPHANQPQPRLLIMPITGTPSLQTAIVVKPTLTLGRERDNDIVLSDEAVSQHHIVLNDIDHAWQVHCQPNARFFLVNGHPCANALLRDGDQIVVGATIIRFEIPLGNDTGGRTPSQTPTQWGTSLEPRLLIECPEARFSAPLREDIITVGRDPSCGLVIPEGVVSHQHARLVRNEQGHYLLEPLSTTNPITLHGTALTGPHLLCEGDVFAIGTTLPTHTVLLRYTARPMR
jgi:pSer/pThr/pTyr-binding forkhead associated (FHA) protein